MCNGDIINAECDLEDIRLAVLFSNFNMTNLHLTTYWLIIHNGLISKNTNVFIADYIDKIAEISDQIDTENEE